MKKSCVITSIYSPSESTIKYCSNKDWDVIIVGDLKTPHDEYLKLEQNNSNVKYLHPNEQEKLFPELSYALGWNLIQRRTIGYAYSYVKE